MSSCAKQKRAALVEWKGLAQSCPSRQGGSYRQYNQPSARPAAQSFPTSTPPATEGPATSPTAPAPTGGTGPFGPPVVRQHLCRGVHTPDLPALRDPDVGSGADAWQPYHPQCAAYPRHADSGEPFELPPGL